MNSVCDCFTVCQQYNTSVTQAVNSTTRVLHRLSTVQHEYYTGSQQYNTNITQAVKSTTRVLHRLSTVQHEYYTGCQQYNTSSTQAVKCTAYCNSITYCRLPLVHNFAMEFKCNQLKIQACVPRIDVAVGLQCYIFFILFIRKCYLSATVHGQA